MPMIGAGLAAAVRASIAALTDEQRADHDQIWDAIGDAIVTYIQANATVAVAGTATAVVSGTATSPVVATGTVS